MKVLIDFKSIYTKMLENNVDFCGVVRTYYDEEKTNVKEEYFTMNGKKEGIYKSYYNDGQLRAEVNYIDGLQQGIFKLYYINGQLWNEVNYINGLRQGILKSYHSNGQLWDELNYIDGKKV